MEILFQRVKQECLLTSRTPFHFDIYKLSSSFLTEEIIIPLWISSLLDLSTMHSADRPVLGPLEIFRPFWERPAESV